MTKTKTTGEVRWKSNLSLSLIVVGLIIITAVSLVVAVTYGTTEITVREVYKAIIGSALDQMGAAGKVSYDQTVATIVLEIRLPRLVLAVLIGIGLSICGAVMQAIVKNPLADPYILGISSGATLGATASVMLGIGSFFGTNAMGIMGFLGALGASFLVMGLSSIGGKSNSIKLILAGTAVGAVCSAVSNFIIFVSNKKEALSQIVHWQMGSMAGAGWVSNMVIAIIMISGMIFFWTQFRVLNMMLMGDDVAITLGTNLQPYRTVYLTITSLMVGFAVYIAGMVGFVGLVIPHIVRMVVGTDHKKLIPIAALVGGIFLMWADVFCRVIIKGAEMPIGILTSLIGAPLFIYMIIKSKYGFGGGQ